MKKVIWILSTLIVFGSAQAQQHTIASLKGTWEAVDADNVRSGIQVADSSQLFLLYEGEKKQIIGYTLDFSKSPAWFDFTVKDGNQNIQLKSLIQFINNDLVQWQIFEGTSRPVHFANDAGDTLYLRRKK